MSQSLANILIHAVWSTKERRPLISDDVRAGLHGYLAGIFKSLESPALIINSVPDQATAQSLWLAARIERRIGNIDAMQDLGRQLRDRFAQSSEALLYERGRFDD